MSDQVEAIDAALERISLPAAVVDLGTAGDPLLAPVVAANEACARLAAAAGANIVGRCLNEFTSSDRLEIARENLNALRTRVEGFQVLGRFVAQNGHESSAHFWVRRLDLSGGTFAAIIVLPENSTSHPIEQAIAISGETDIGFIVTDREWRIEHRSGDVRDMLGETDASIGAPLLATVHPSDAPSFILTAIQAMLSRRSLIGRGRFRAINDSWRDTVYLVAALDEHEPPRLGVVLGVPSEDPEIDIRTRGMELEQHLRRIAMEVRTAYLLPAAIDRVPPDRVRLLAELSERQLEIVTRLVNGERVPAIANTMHLSPSTVRNHLTAIFRKFGVHSQVDLITLLKRS
jgi:DNA-binding CsgD family transcriptional regulator